MLRSIRFKVLAMATLFLALFAITTGLSIRLVGQVVDELDAITGSHVPLDELVARIDVTAFEYELALRRSMTQETGADGGADLHRSLGALADSLRADAATIRGLLEAGIGDPRNDPPDRIVLARIAGAFTVLERRVEPFLARGAAVQAAIESGDDAQARKLAAGFQGGDEWLERDLATMRAALDELTMTSMREVETHEERILSVSVALFALATVAGLTLFIALTNRLQRSFRQLLDGTRAVETGALDVALPVASADETGQLARAFNRMVTQLREKERVRDTFGKYLDPRVVARLVDAQAHGDTLSERQPATIFFSDIKGFSGMSEDLTPGAMVNLLNSYFTAVTREIRSRHGVIDKFIGDAVMAFWTAPFSPGDRQAADACMAALAQQEAIAAFRAELPHIIGLRRKLPEFGVRMGLATGEVVIGTIGSDITRSYTVIGDVVNAASRLERANKAYGTSILIDDATFRLAQGEIAARELDLLTVAGKTEPRLIHELVAAADRLTQAAAELNDLFAQGLAAYRAQDWDAAERHFGLCQARRPGDGPSAVFLRRVAALRATPPPAEWGGVWRLTDK
ncbi:MAG: HAMP domain-containing protein [Alphaproteobacteria bacterium]|nr:HAMP domain-containing protein [Alphaproteobacteria bacterium]